MESKIREFRLKENKSNFFSKNIYILDIALFIILSLSILYGFKDNMTLPSMIFIFIAFILFLAVIIYEVYAASIRKNSKIADLAISEDRIIIPFGPFGKSKVLYVKHIIELFVPKYDEIVELTYKDSTKIHIKLNGYSKEDKIEIKELFNKISSDFGKSDDKLDTQSKTYNIVNGKAYIK